MATGHRAGRGLVTLALLSVVPAGCEAVVYADDLVSEESRSGFVTTPAAVASMIGFVVGIPVDLLAAPISYPVYLARKARYPDTADPVSILLFPSFVLSRAGAIVVGGPLDVLEFAFYRAWRSSTPAPETASRPGSGGTAGVSPATAPDR